MGWDLINIDTIRSRHQILTYQLKQGTKSSYYLMDGTKGLLPERLSFIPYSGKDGIRKAYSEIDGRYKINEPGHYYLMNERKIHTKLIAVKNYPQFIGWGEIDERFRIYDLLILYSANGCQHDFQIHHFKGLAKIELLESVCNYLQSYFMQKAS